MMRHTTLTSPDLPVLVALLLALGLAGTGCGTRRAAEEEDAAAIRAKVRTVAIVRPSSWTSVVEREQVEEAFLGRATER
ncbi:hypothetical protein K2X89_00175, partial [Myxococcota bacterium]|nr:hypothetical protein [Myxococcota bacterium]